MPPKRTYDDPCGAARALDAVGERWALLVVRELLHGPKRFTALSGGLPGMSQNVLSQRLQELEALGVVQRRRLGPPASTPVYELTSRGYELESVLLALARWGSRLPMESNAQLSADALILALKTTFDVRAASGLRARYELRLGDDHLVAEIAHGRFQVVRGNAEHPDVTFETDVATLRELVFARRSLAEAERSGDVRVRGDRRAAAHFSRSFPRPTTTLRSKS